MNYLLGFFAIISIFASNSFAQNTVEKDQAFGIARIYCDQMPVVESDGSQTQMQILVFTETPGKRSPESALATIFDSKVRLREDVDLTMLTGKLSLRSGEPFFESQTSYSKLNIEVKSTGSSHVEYSYLSKGKWVVIYNGSARCKNIQFESVGAHN